MGFESDVSSILPSHPILYISGPIVPGMWLISGPIVPEMWSHDWVTDTSVGICLPWCGILSATTGWP